MVRLTKLLPRQLSIVKRTPQGLYLLRVIWLVHRTSVVLSVNDSPLVSMVKDTDSLAVWSDGPWNKYDPGMAKHVDLLCLGYIFES